MSADQKPGVLRLLEAGETVAGVSRLTGVSQSTVRSWQKKAAAAAIRAAGEAKEQILNIVGHPWIPAFLQEMAETASSTKAAAAAGVTRTHAYIVRGEEPAFEEAWLLARKIGAEALEDEAIRRGREGWLEPVFQRGEQIGQVRKYSDACLIQMLRANLPDRHSTRHQVSGPDGAPLTVAIIRANPDEL